MKRKLLICFLLSAFCSSAASAQSDSTVRIFKTGMAVYAELGMLPNNKTLRDQLARLQVKPFTSFMGNLVLARRTESERWFSEARIIIMNSTNYTSDRDTRKAYLNGLGIGTDGGPKLVNTARWNVTVPLGADFMLYRLNIKNNASVSAQQLLNNPSAYQAVKLYTANIASATSSPIDLTTGTVGDPIPTGPGCEGIDSTPDGKQVWTTNNQGATVSVIDTATNRVVATLACPGFPIRVKITPDGKRALVSCPMTNDLAVFDVAKLRDVSTYEDPHHYAEGISHVIVIGTPVLRDGKMTDALPGRVLRR